MWGAALGKAVWEECETGSSREQKHVKDTATRNAPDPETHRVHRTKHLHDKASRQNFQKQKLGGKKLITVTYIRVKEFCLTRNNIDKYNTVTRMGRKHL